jgi:hypothetical protein
MLQLCIADLQEVHRFLCFLKKYDWYPQPDDAYDFRDQIDRTGGGRKLNLHEALYLNDLLTDCYAVCRKYGTALETLFAADCKEFAGIS